VRVQLSWALRLLLCLCTPLIPALNFAPPAHAAGGLAALQGDLGRQLAAAGPHDGAYVYDLTAHRVLFSERAAAMRPPASVEKLYTATTLLERLGPGYRLTTSVLGAGHMAPGGVWEGSIYLRGGGDPTFGSSAFIAHHYGGIGSSVSTLAHQLARGDGIRTITGRVMGDESLFDSRRGEPSSGYAPDPFLEGSLSALAFNRGQAGSESGPHAPAAYAARQLRAALKAAGVTVSGSSGAASTPAGAVSLASVSSPTISQLLGLMLPPSDNFFAETLLKGLGARLAGSGTTSAGARIAASTITSLLGIHPRIVDGSGLSEVDSTSPYQVADLLVELYPSAAGAVLRESMAVAGRTGTLELRMRNTAAAGRCIGKTGTLTGVSNLVGYCPSRNGHELAFAIFTDAIAIPLAHTFQDHMAITLANASP
jgi:D-alanyl-D-alanine carboxypeptidase/D-alanyl-D-alanine-endopeptidase (penicillin-binding protein 4)